MQSGGGDGNESNGIQLDQYKEALSMFYEKEDEMDIDPLFSEPRPCRKKCKVEGVLPNSDIMQVSYTSIHQKKVRTSLWDFL